MSDESKAKENKQENVADAHDAALKSQDTTSPVSDQAPKTVAAGVPSGVVPAEAHFAPGDSVQVEKEGAWYDAKIVNATPIGVPDQLTGEQIKYTVNYEASNGISAKNPEQYVPQSRVRACATDAADDSVKDEDRVEAPSDQEAKDVRENLEARKKAVAQARGQYPSAADVEAAKKPGDKEEPGSPANNPDLNGAINDPEKAEVENFNGDKKEQEDNTVVNPGGSVSVDTDPENQVRGAASDTTAEGAANPAASVAHNTADAAELEAEQKEEAKTDEENKKD